MALVLFLGSNQYVVACFSCVIHSNCKRAFSEENDTLQAEMQRHKDQLSLNPSTRHAVKHTGELEVLQHHSSVS